MSDYGKQTLPFAYMQFPNYDFGIHALEFGALGTYVAHEISHGFDYDGKDYNSEGDNSIWWISKTAQKYRKQAKCFVNSYDKLEIKEINTKVDGTFTLNENIADNGGLSVSFKAYQLFKKHNKDLKFPGFQNFSHEKLFTMGFAFGFCSYSNENGLKSLVKDEHTPYEQRVNGVFINFKEFADIWNCPKGSFMNPEGEKCKLW